MKMHSYILTNLDFHHNKTDISLPPEYKSKIILPKSENKESNISQDEANYAMKDNQSQQEDKVKYPNNLKDKNCLH